jgi:hypothetical protein
MLESNQNLLRYSKKASNVNLEMLPSTEVSSLVSLKHLGTSIYIYQVDGCFFDDGSHVCGMMKGALYLR